MKNPFKNTTFLFGVTKYQNLPEDIGTEIILSGRSNAGKSSALNAITQNRKLARISKTPGRTTEINFFQVEENFKLLDLPGYGFAKSITLNYLICQVMDLQNLVTHEEKIGVLCLVNILKTEMRLRLS